MKNCNKFFAGSTLGYSLALYLGCAKEDYLSGVGFGYQSTIGASGQGVFFQSYG
jgi:hypothetical protein